jgi:hypothetical protein
LCVLANPSDLPRFDEARIWRDIEDTLQPFQARGAFAYERLADPTEAALRKRLAQGPWHVLHFVVHAQERGAAHYGTIALQSSDGRARNLTAGYVAGLLKETPSLKLVVLQGCDEASACFDTVAKALVEQAGVVVVTAPPLYRKAPQVFLSKLYAGLLMGLNAESLSRELATALPPVAINAPGVQVLCSDRARPIFSAEMPQVASMAATSTAGNAGNVASSVSPAGEPAWHEVLKRKRAAGEFDVFLCHNSADKPAVKRIGQQLKEAGILPWLDVWELPPGQPWQPLLEQQIGCIKSAAVCFGSSGVGPWQEQEMYGFLREFVSRKTPVIPLLLPDAPHAPELPIFLRAMTWVDFRNGDPDPLEGLIWGITGQRPGD